MNKVVLFGAAACNYEDRLKSLLRSRWQIGAVRDESALTELRDALAQADALISPCWSKEMMLPAVKLKLIQAIGAGINFYDTTALPRGCVLCNVYEHEVPIAEYVIGAMVALNVGFVFHNRQLRQGKWDGSARNEGQTHQELAQKTVGLIGYGSIGREVTRRAQAFGMNVHAIRARPELPLGYVKPAWIGGPRQLDVLLQASDYLVVCCTLNEQTRGLLNRSNLTQLKPSAYLINVARAEVIEEGALFDVLAERRIAGAALDVWYRYPEAREQSQLPSQLPFHTLDNVLMTPHLSAWTDPMIDRRWRKIAANLDALAEGRLLHNIVSSNLRHQL